MDLHGKKVVVLGANGGIGSSVVEILKHEGAQVVEITKDDIDLTNIDAVEKFSKRLAHKNPVIDAFINAAGIGIYQSLEEINKKDWETSLNINLTGPLFFIKGILSSMNKKNSVVINIGSGMGKKAYGKDRVPYITSKFALRGMSLALNKDYEGKYPEFCLVTLGSVMTSFGPGGIEARKKLASKGKLYFEPSWVAERIVYVIKDKERQREYTFYPKDYIKG